MKRGSARLLWMVALLVVAGLFALLPLVAQSREPREIVIVAKGMSFFAGGPGRSDARNPTIRVQPGERIRITLVNDDPGFDHDFSVRAWSIETPVVRGAGRTFVEFRAPDTPGTTQYTCSLHAAMMTGTIEIAAAAPIK